MSLTGNFMPFSALPGSVRVALAFEAEIERQWIALQCVLPMPPSREVFAEEIRRANLTSRHRVEPREIAHRMIREWASA